MNDDAVGKPPVDRGLEGAKALLNLHKHLRDRQGEYAATHWRARPFDPACKESVERDAATINAIRLVIPDWAGENWEAVYQKLRHGGYSVDELRKWTVFQIRMCFATGALRLIQISGRSGTTEPTIGPVMTHYVAGTGAGKPSNRKRSLGHGQTIVAKARRDVLLNWLDERGGFDGSLAEMLVAVKKDAKLNYSRTTLWRDLQTTKYARQLGNPKRAARKASGQSSNEQEAVSNEHAPDDLSHLDAYIMPDDDDDGVSSK